MKKIALFTVLMLLGMTLSVFAQDTNLVPENAAFLLNVNFAKLLTNEQVKKAIDAQMAKQSPEEKKKYDEFVTKSGIDPLKSITNLMVFVVPPANPAEKPEKQEAGVVVTGTFDSAKIIAAVSSDEKAKADVTIEKFEGLDAIKGKKETDGMAAFLDATNVVIGTPAALKAVVDTKKGARKNLSTNTAFSAILAKADKSANVWGAAILPQAVKDQAKANPQSAPLAALNAIFFSFNYDANLGINLTGEVDKKENMDGVMTTLNGFLAMLKMGAAQFAPESGEVLNMIKIESAETTAKISLSVSKDKLEEVKKKIEERMKNPQVAPGAAPAPQEGSK